MNDNNCTFSNQVGGNLVFDLSLVLFHLFHAINEEPIFSFRLHKIVKHILLSYNNVVFNGKIIKIKLEHLYTRKQFV